MTTTKNFTLSRFAYSTHLVFTLCALCALWGYSAAQNFNQVQPGVEYAQVHHKLGEEPVKINLLRLDLTRVRLDVRHALDSSIGTEKTSSIAKRHNAIAAINAGFFRLDTSIFAGEAAGILQIDGSTLSEPEKDRIALFIINDPERTGPDKTGIHFRHYSTRHYLRIGKSEIDIDGIDRERKPNELVRFNPEFGRTTLTTPGGIEVVVRDRRIVSVFENGSSTEIPRDGFVISAVGTAADALRKIVRNGRRVEVLYSYVQPLDDSEGFYTLGTLAALADDVTNGVPQLIKNGKIDITWEQEKASRSFVEARHPRTAVAKLKDGKFLMMTVDGRQPGVSVGMSLQELAEYLFSLGAVDAMNLDGGGSTTMYLDGKVVNTPSDQTGERKIGDAIVVTLRDRKN